MNYWGNQKLLTLPTTAFLCSQRCPAAVVLRSYDWAKAQRAAGRCIICGNHSPLEQDVFDILLRGTQPLVLVLARGLQRRWSPGIEAAVEAQRLLVVSPFAATVRRVTRATAAQRNQVLISLSKQIVVGHVSPGGQLFQLLTAKDYQEVEDVL